MAALALVAGLLIWQKPWRKTMAAGPVSVAPANPATSGEVAGNQAAKNGNLPVEPTAPAKTADDNIELFALPQAAYEGNLGEVKALIAKGADVNARWPKDNNFTPLLFAVTKGHENLRGIFDTSGFKKINELKDRTKNVDYPRQYAEIVSLLLANGADINAKAPNGETPLLVSLQFGCSDMAQLLIAKGADVNAKDNQGTTPLFSAALGNDKDMENLLMAKGAKVDIFTASAMGDIERVRGFLNSNPSMISATQGVLTPFHVAAYSGQTEMMKFLLGKGVDVNAGYPEKITPLFLAANLDAVELLIAKGAIINSESSNSQSPLFGAAWGGNKAIGELLIAKGADVNAKNDIGWTPLFAAAMTSKGSNDMVELLIAKGADVNAKDKDSRTPLWAAVNRNHLERARLLVSKGADVNAKYKEGNTALHIAARFAYKEFVGFLLTNGANVNAIQDAGWTPLHHAALGGNKDIVEMLLTKGADANAREKDGKTPDIVARDEGYADIAELIKKHQAKNPPTTAPVPPEALKRGLVLHFDFDAEPVSGKVPDLSGQGNYGEAVNVQWVADGHRGGSMVFGLTNNSYIRVPNNDSLNPTNLTLAAWIKTSYTDGIWRRIFDKATRKSYTLTMGANLVQDKSWQSGQFILEAGNQWTPSRVNVADGQWHLVAGTFDGTLLRLYLDGRSVGETRPAKGNPEPTSNDLTVGGNQFDPAAANDEAGPFNGMMDNVMIFNRALSAEEIRALYDSQNTKENAPPASVEPFALHQAAYEGNLEEVKGLLAKGVDANAKGPKDPNFTPLFFAASEGNEVIKVYFNTPGFKNFNEVKDRTKSVNYTRQYPEIASLLLDHSADINKKISVGGTPLHLAARFNYLDMAKLLVAKGADMEATHSSSGGTPLFTAAFYNNKDVKDFFEAKGAKTDIFILAAEGNIEGVKARLKDGASGTQSVNSAMKNGMTPLHCAARNGQTEMVKFLIENGATVDAGYFEGNLPKALTPLYLAAAQGHSDTVKLLVDKGANTNGLPSNFSLPLNGAALKEK